jgi:hypothetical protein
MSSQIDTPSRVVAPSVPFGTSTVVRRVPGVKNRLSSKYR